MTVFVSGCAGGVSQTNRHLFPEIMRCRGMAVWMAVRVGG